MKIPKSQIEKIKFTDIDFEGDRAFIDYVANVTLADKTTHSISERIFFMYRNNLYATFKAKNCQKLKQIANLWGRESDYLTQDTAMYLLFVIYRKLDIDSPNMDYFFINNLND